MGTFTRMAVSLKALYVKLTAPRVVTTIEGIYSELSTKGKITLVKYVASNHFISDAPLKF
jgi:hypothetical protein